MIIFSEFLITSIPLLLQFYAEMYREIDFKNTMLELENEYNVPKIKSYDFIIVGGGSAGSVVAGRLSEYFDVLLLESGGNPSPGTFVPYFASGLVGAVGSNPSLNYFYQSVPQSYAALANGGITRMHTGRMLGGSGSSSNLVHSRGNPKDYDNWANLLNDDSFSYANVLKYFKKMETFVGRRFGNESDEYYGHDGPILVNTTILPILDYWLEAAAELGYDIGDPNGYQREGFTPMTVAVRNGHRSSSYIEYVRPHEKLRNSLTIIRYANVTQILLDNEKKAYGVAYIRHGFPQIAHAQKEIILSAGTFSSPLLLMKSGIGPESVLNAAEIPVKVPLEAVGKNLKDHLAFVVRDFSVNDTTLFSKLDTSDAERVMENFHNGEGILAETTGGPQCFIASTVAEPGWPDVWIEIYLRVSVDGTQEIISFHDNIGRPKSVGLFSMDTEKYKLGFRDDEELALIDYQYLTHPDDMVAMLDGVRLIFKIIETDVFRSINFTHDAEPNPACSAFPFLSDDYWRCRIQRDSFSYRHMIGTCSLGPDSGNSNTSVVDTKFRVRGVTNLRVVDASVIPENTNANLNAPVLMLAEKASEDIINLYRGPDRNKARSTVIDTANVLFLVITLMFTVYV